MTKKIIFALLVIATIVSFASLPAMAQDTQTRPVASVRENVLALGTKPLLSRPWSGNKVAPPPAPPYCNGNGGSCLFYGGDFDENDTNANALSNETDIIVPGTPYGSAVYANFQVPAGQTWTVTGLLSNVFATVTGVSPNVGYWEIRSGVSVANEGILVASGSSPNSFKATGRIDFGLGEYTVKVFITPSVTLTSGTYFMVVVPQCVMTNVTCPGARYFLTDVEDKPPVNKRGFQMSNDAFFNSTFFGANYEPTWGSTGACAGLGCNRFSFGVIGTK
jgi:hypothetical protein